MEAKEYLDVYSEATPNPDTMKFVFNKMILPGESVDYPEPGKAGNSPLAKNLFEFNFVNGVFIMNNFVTITRKPGIGWEEIVPIMREFLKSYIAAGEPVLNEAVQEVTKDFGDDNATVEQIRNILDEYIKPAVEMDGGQITFRDYEKGVVTVELRGSCSGCPSSSVTLKKGIEGMLTRMVPAVKEVVAHSL